MKGDMRNACRSSVGLADRKREFGKPMYRREGPNKIDLIEV
jgi:hypothetical protein